MRILVLLFICISFSALAEENEIKEDENLRKDFHPASTQNEKTLEYILDQAAKHFNIGSNYDYTNTSLSSEFLDAIKAGQNKAISHNCTGTESLGTNCGLKYNPVTCNIDIPLIYFFLTQTSNEFTTQISTSEDAEGLHPSKYRLNYSDHEWKIDGVQCSNGDTYNFD